MAKLDAHDLPKAVHTYRTVRKFKGYAYLRHKDFVWECVHEHGNAEEAVRCAKANAFIPALGTTRRATET